MSEHQHVFIADSNLCFGCGRTREQLRAEESWALTIQTQQKLADAINRLAEVLAEKL